MTFSLQFLRNLKKDWDARLILKHILGWTLFIAYEVSFVSFSTGTSFPFKDYIFYYALNILLFYINAHFVLNNSIKFPKSYLVVQLSILLEIVIYLLIKYVLDYFLATPHATFFNQLLYVRKFLVLNAFRGIYFIGFSSLYWSILRVAAFRKQVFETEKIQLTTMKEKAELERNLAEAENAYLQQQINPHLLFNTLTFIHNTYHKFSREASQCVLLLVEIMRFSLDEVGSDHKALLIREIEQIRNFIELNQLRFNHQLYIDFHVEGEINNQQIIPLILLTLTENIFKHGNLKTKEASARLYISVSENSELTFISWNLKKHRSERKRLRSIGIQNVIKRLNYSYRQRYLLNIKDEDDSYGLELRVQL